LRIFENDKTDLHQSFFRVYRKYTCLLQPALKSNKLGF